MALAVFALAAGSSAPADAQEKPRARLRAVSPEADTYVSAAQPQRNFGLMPVLRADGSPLTTVYLRFRIKKPMGDISGVTLLLHARTAARTVYQVRHVRDDEWREQRLTFGSAPRLSLRYASSTPIRRAEWNAVDVTDFVADDNHEVCLAITTKSPVGVLFSSRESRHSPRLVLRTNQTPSEADPPTP